MAGALICAVSDDDPAAARRAAAASVGFYATVRTYEELFSGQGFGSRLAGIRSAFAEGDGDRLAEAVGEDMTDAFAAAGTTAAVRERARAYEGVADRLWANPPHHLQDAQAPPLAGGDPVGPWHPRLTFPSTARGAISARRPSRRRRRAGAGPRAGRASWCSATRRAPCTSTCGSRRTARWPPGRSPRARPCARASSAWRCAPRTTR